MMIGIDKLDAEACKARGIPIFNTPGVNAQAVAETVLSLTMSVARQVGRITALQTQGEAVPKETCSGLIIRNKTIGIVGMGNIGQKVAASKVGSGVRLWHMTRCCPRTHGQIFHMFELQHSRTFSTYPTS
jgi:phosphoglycerate dehydrogenase-like enzyme